MRAFSGNIRKEERGTKDKTGALAEKRKLILLSPKEIRSNPAQPRKRFSEEELRSLAESIRQNGLLQPVSVRKAKEGWELISGERRLRASLLAGLEQVPCLVCSCTETQSAVLAMIENLQRQDLSLFEEAEGIRRLIEEWNVTQEEAASRLGKSQSALANKLRLLQYSEKEREAIQEKGLSERHARTLLRLRQEMKEEEMVSLIYRVGEEELTVARTEELAESLLQKKQRKPEPTQNGKPKRKILLKDVRIFVNTIHHAVDVMKKSGIRAENLQTETEDYIEYRIRIPKETPDIHTA